MAGEENRKIFFNDRNLGLSEGYHILAGIPKLQDIDHNADGVPELLKRLLLLFRKERISEGAPTVYVFISTRFLYFSFSLSTFV